MSENADDDNQPGLPPGIFTSRNFDIGDRSQLLKAGFSGWYENLVSKSIDVAHCERSVENAMSHPALKFLMRAMASSGCKFNARRHISCELCSTKTIAGAYDPKYNQVVVCANVARTSGDVYLVLGYNMLQMFDRCRAHVDFRNIDHVACTEVRANNLFVCGSYSEGRKRAVAPLFNYEGTQERCVHKQSVIGVQQLMGVDEPTAAAAVNRVFSRCYGDLEPFGQRFATADVAEILYHRRRNYGYY